ncbi:DNA sulfur modification protein DndB [Methylomonas fluvii]|uniref:DNA sulfur modification protein DndB n=1 Tax=Methylomonas fluvii TaxID=1854564 RepID=A0ABR9DGQ0_9GAMM|nr:DNA sulfur modification protein DndB [Methylomonas fluvii]MBD9362277.1 DNA sulfur modification protein DndB [Methylomonas fluvii]
MLDTEFCHSFPAIRGLQAGRPCYIAMCPMRIVPSLFKFNEEEVPPELRAQRTLNKSRIPEITSYLVDNPNDYTLSSLTASVNAMVNFSPFSATGPGQFMGSLLIPMDAQILINDGQHRRAAIEQAIKENPELGYDNISVLFFIDEGLERSQQMFADLNKHAVRPSDSISTLYDFRDSISDLARFLSKEVEIFSRMTELENSSISNRSSKLFTLSSIKNASKALLRKGNKDPITEEEKLLAAAYWSEVGHNMPDWIKAKNKEVVTYELRDQYIHAHGVMLQAMGNIGADLLSNYQTDWKKRLSQLSNIDWSRQNKDWEGRALVHGRVSKARTNVLLTGNYIKQHLGTSLNDIEESLEKEFQQ